MPRKNLLFIYTDQQRYDTLACYGNEQIEMPNLNRFAQTATVFNRAYVAQPVCTASRSSILTGLHPHRTGCVENNMPLRPDIKCLPEYLPDDYVTGHFGKWHLGDEIFPQHGFDEWRGIDDAYAEFYGADRDRSAKSHYHHFLVEHGMTPRNGETFGRGEVAQLPEELSKPAFLAEESVEFLRRNQDNPFALYLNFFEPHTPNNGPRDSQYDRSTIALPDNFDNVPGPDAPLKNRLLHRHTLAAGKDGQKRTREDFVDYIARYWGLCSLVDTHAGIVLDELEKLGLSDSTVVVFTSDHGDMLGNHQLLLKTFMYDESSRVPLLIRQPGQQQQTKVDGPVSLVDLVPTLLDLLHVECPSGLDGASLNSLLDGSTPADRDVFIEWNGPNGALASGERPGGYTYAKGESFGVTDEQLRLAARAAIRTIVTVDGWKFNYSMLGEHELFNLNEDPGETRNLAFDPDQANRVNDLCVRIRQWQARTDDTVPVVG